MKICRCNINFADVNLIGTSGMTRKMNRTTPNNLTCKPQREGCVHGGFSFSQMNKAHGVLTDSKCSLKFRK